MITSRGKRGRLLHSYLCVKRPRFHYALSIKRLYAPAKITQNPIERIKVLYLYFYVFLKEIEIMNYFYYF